MKNIRLLLLAILSVACFAQQKFTLEQVMSAPFPNNLCVAKHSGRIAWVFNSKGVRNIWIAEAPDFKARPVTHYDIDGEPIASLRLTPNGKTVYLPAVARPITGAKSLIRSTSPPSDRLSEIE